MKQFLIVLLLLLANSGYSGPVFPRILNSGTDKLLQPVAPAEKAAVPFIIHRAQQALTDIIVHDIFSPPVASRIYAYANIAAYEALVGTGQNLVPLRKISASLPDLEGIKAGRQVSAELSSVYAFLLTAKALVFSEQRMEDTIGVLLSQFQKTVPDQKTFSNSLAFGKRIADSILSWSAADFYKKTRSLRRYSHKREAGKWIPTPPAYIAAIEPNWNLMRCLFMDSASQFKPEQPAIYSSDSTSRFYQQLLQVYNTGKNLSPEQRDIALFWDCNPFFVNTSGHLMYATKKLSPGGHWISITGIAARNSNKNLAETIQAYTMVSIALYDGFISCWDEKYRSNYIRPETVINAMVDESWRPLLQTPPFPEYTSGHSVISNAAAVVLTHLFGNDFAFADDTETAFGLPVRYFNSFIEAAEEAAISRLYGGIHFYDAIENGKLQGLNLGRHIVQKLQNADSRYKIPASSR